MSGAGKLSAILAALALALAAFAWWGLYTASGAVAFDEMDGLIPFFAGVLAAMLAIGAAVVWSLGRRRGG